MKFIKYLLFFCLISKATFSVVWVDNATSYPIKFVLYWPGGSSQSAPNNSGDIVSLSPGSAGNVYEGGASAVKYGYRVYADTNNTGEKNIEKWPLVISTIPDDINRNVFIGHLWSAGNHKMVIYNTITDDGSVKFNICDQVV